MTSKPTKSLLNYEFISAFHYPNKKYTENLYQTHLQSKNTKKRSQSFMTNGKSSKQLEGHKKHYISFNKSFDKKSMDQSSCILSKNSSNKKRKQFSYQSRQAVKGAIRKNGADQRFSYYFNQNHLPQFDSQGSSHFSRRVQNRSLNDRNSEQINAQKKPKKKVIPKDFIKQECRQECMVINENINPNLRDSEIRKVDGMTSKILSQLQSKSQTIDLLKFSIKTKLSKDTPNSSSHNFNPSLTSQSQSQREHIEEILKLKELQANFYIEKITSLQNELNKSKKQRKSLQQEVHTKCIREHRRSLMQKVRFEEQNQLLKRENEALRTIILKKINRS